MQCGQLPETSLVSKAEEGPSPVGVTLPHGRVISHVSHMPPFLPLHDDVFVHAGMFTE